MAPAPIVDQPWSSQPKPSKSVVAHPLCPLSADEISRAGDVLKTKYPSNTVLHFKVITLQEPPKTQMVAYLDAEHAAGQLPHIDRKAFISYYIRNTVCLNSMIEFRGCSARMADVLPMQDKLHEAIIDLTTQSVDDIIRLGPNLHAPADGPEIMLMEEIALKDEKVKAALEKLRLPTGTAVICDPWIYGA